MKRLIKKSNTYAEFMYSDEKYTIFKSPITSNDVEIVEFQSQYKSIRGIIDKGITYIWAGDFLHDDINRYINNSNNKFLTSKECLNVNVNGVFRFCYDGCFIFDGNNEFSLKQIIEYIVRYKNDLNLISSGDLEKTRLSIWNVDDYKKCVDFYFSKLKEIINEK